MFEDFKKNGWKEGLLAGAFSTLGLMLWQLGKSAVKGMKHKDDDVDDDENITYTDFSNGVDDGPTEE
jgi:hypothetical protein